MEGVAARRRTRSRWQSHQRALEAIEAGEFADEMTPVKSSSATRTWPPAACAKTAHVDTDEGPRADTSLEGLAKLRPVFRKGRSASRPATARRRSDGAGALILASEKAVKQFGLKPLARFVSFAVRGVPPEIMGIGPIEAIPGGVEHAGLKQDEMDWIELNEAFAAQSLAVIDTSASTPPRSTRWAARSRSATRWAPPARSAPPPWSTRCAATS